MFRATNNHFFLFHQPFFSLITGKYILNFFCKAVLFKMTFKILFPHWKNYKKHCILLKTNFETPLLFFKGCSCTDNCFGLLKIWFTHFLFDQQMRPSKKCYMLWSDFLLVLLFHFLTYCFQTMC